MEKATLEGVVQRLDRLERMVSEMNQQFSQTIEALAAEALKDRETAALRKTAKARNNKQDAQIAKEALTKIYKKMGIPPDFELEPLKEVRKRMVASGIRPEDNEFSRAIIAEREK